MACSSSPISAEAHAGCLAVADALGQAVALQCEVLEATLQQLGCSSGSSDGRGPGRVASGATAEPDSTGQENVPPCSAAAGGDAFVAGIKRPAAQQHGGGAPDADGSVLVVDGQRAGRQLSDCWVQLAAAQADVDLAVSQMPALA